MVKCQDKNGGIVYVDRPCEALGLHAIGSVKERVNVAPAPPSVESEKETSAPSAPQVAPDCKADASASCRDARPESNRSHGVARGQDPARERAISRCKKNRGADCESDEGLKEWLRQDRPITDEERQAAVAERQLREQCEKSKFAGPECSDLPTDAGPTLKR